MREGHPQVRLDALTLVSFRNIERLALAPGPRFNVISGRNGSGKTNVLESIYLTGSLRSFRTSAVRELVRHGDGEARVVAVLGGAAAGMTCEIRLGEDARQVRVDGKAPRADGAHFRAVPMVLFHPGHMELVQGGPEGRRRFLDRALFQADATYPAAHRAYVRALKSRNRILKDKPPDPRSLDAFDAQIATNGAEITFARERFVAALAPLFEEGLEEVAEVKDGTIAYAASARTAEEIAGALKTSRGKDIARGFTSIGPHTDDLEFSFQGRPARKFASQGQCRTAVLAAKIAETRALAAATSRTPILLLDDVSSELDDRRNERLLAFLSRLGGQVFVTTTHRKHIAVDGERRDFEVAEGRIAELDASGE